MEGLPPPMRRTRTTEKVKKVVTLDPPSLPPAPFELEHLVFLEAKSASGEVLRST